MESLYEMHVKRFIFNELNPLVKKYKDLIASKQKTIKYYEKKGMSGACIATTGEIQAYNVIIKDLKHDDRNEENRNTQH